MWVDRVVTKTRAANKRMQREDLERKETRAKDEISKCIRI